VTTVALLGFSLAVVLGSTMPSDSVEIATPAAQTQVKAGLNAMQEGKYDEAQKSFKAALSATSVPSEQDQIMIWNARARAANGQVEESRALLRLALKRPSPALAAELGRSLLMHQPVDTKEAIHFLTTTAKSFGGKSAEVLIALARAFVVDEQYASAAQVYRRIINQINKKELRAYTGLAEAYILDQKYKDATEIMDAAQKIFPDNPEVMFYVGRVKERDARVKGNSGVAAHYYLAAAQLAKGQTPRFSAAAMYAFLLAQDSPSAIGVYGRQRAKTPGDSFVLWFTGLDEELAWRIPEALKLYQEAIAKNPENVYAHYVLARVYLGVGNKGLRLSGVEPPESFRVAPFVDPARGLQEVSIIKFLDPSFPQLGPLRALYEQSMERQVQSETSTPETAQAVDKLIKYTIKMNKYR
jgi:tetratricopeptide (TPR) repeat protein